MLRTASEVIASGDDGAVVDFAIEVGRQAAAALEELGVAKSYLRKVAAKSQGSWRVEIPGNIGVATVVFDRDVPKPRKGKDLRDIEPNLSEETFARLFTKSVTVKPVEGFISRLDGLSPSEKAIVDRFIEVRPQTPKVYLPK